MRRIIITLICAVFASQSYAQSNNTNFLDVAYKSDDGYSMCIIKPTIDNFIRLINMSEIQFVQAMKNYQYFADDESGGKYVSYWNGSIDNIISKSVNTYMYNIMRKEIRCLVPMDMIYPQGAIQDLYRALRQYYVTSASSTDKFSLSYNGDIYEFYITTHNSSTYDIQVLKK